MEGSSVSKNPFEWAERSRQFLNEVQIEFKKVTWPSQKETVAGTISVVVIAIVVGLLLSFVDLGLVRVVNALLN
jgi:preprotein translocase subunit SecE